MSIICRHQLKMLHTMSKLRFVIQTLGHYGTSWIFIRLVVVLDKPFTKCFAPLWPLFSIQTITEVASIPEKSSGVVTRNPLGFPKKALSSSTSEASPVNARTCLFVFALITSVAALTSRTGRIRFLWTPQRTTTMGWSVTLRTACFNPMLIASSVLETLIFFDFHPSTVCCILYSSSIFSTWF